MSDFLAFFPTLKKSNDGKQSMLRIASFVHYKNLAARGGKKYKVKYGIYRARYPNAQSALQHFVRDFARLFI